MIVNEFFKTLLDVRQKNELKDISYNDGTISRKRFWIGLCHIDIKLIEDWINRIYK